jgi:hypothetical protein
MFTFPILESSQPGFVVFTDKTPKTIDNAEWQAATRKYGKHHNKDPIWNSPSSFLNKQ